MASASIEHVNLTVSDLKQSAEILCSLFGWRIRWQGPSALGGQTMHVGSDDGYIAIYQREDAAAEPRRHPKGSPLNHVGIVVDDLEAVESRARSLGLTPFNHGDYEPGRRFYLFDRDGIEFEIVSYARDRAE